MSWGPCFIVTTSMFIPGGARRSTDVCCILQYQNRRALNELDARRWRRCLQWNPPAHVTEAPSFCQLEHDPPHQDSDQHLHHWFPRDTGESTEHPANVFHRHALGQLMLVLFFFLHLKASPSYLTHDGVGLPPRPLSSVPSLT